MIGLKYDYVPTQYVDGDWLASARPTLEAWLTSRPDGSVALSPEETEEKRQSDPDAITLTSGMVIDFERVARIGEATIHVTSADVWRIEGTIPFCPPGAILRVNTDSDQAVPWECNAEDLAAAIAEAETLPYSGRIYFEAWQRYALPQRFTGSAFADATS